MDRAPLNSNSIRSSILDEIAGERRRQIEEEGFTPEHDDAHEAGELARAAACYAVDDEDRCYEGVWPWEDEWWKPTHTRQDLIKAAALLVAEIERGDRAAASSQ